jgi:predicted DNA-binding transcriptional regulator AlpA
MHPQAFNELRRASIGALDDEALLNSAQVKARVGNVSDMCIWRWLRDERVQFPQPIQINRRNYWKLGDLRAWQAKHTNKIAA